MPKSFSPAALPNHFLCLPTVQVYPSQSPVKGRDERGCAHDVPFGRIRPQQRLNTHGDRLRRRVTHEDQRDQQADNNALRANLRNRYLHLTQMQDRVAELNGVGNPGALLYARFERDDHANQQIVHYYVPKWLPIGSSPEDGLRLTAPKVKPHHAELLFRDGMYWIQNLASSGSVRVGCHGLATNEVLALAAGDTLDIGSAQFTFEGY